MINPADIIPALVALGVYPPSGGNGSGFQMNCATDYVTLFVRNENTFAQGTTAANVMNLVHITVPCRLKVRPAICVNLGFTGAFFKAALYQNTTNFGPALSPGAELIYDLGTFDCSTPGWVYGSELWIEPGEYLAGQICNTGQANHLKRITVTEVDNARVGISSQSVRSFFTLAHNADDPLPSNLYGTAIGTVNSISHYLCFQILENG